MVLTSTVEKAPAGEDVRRLVNRLKHLPSSVIVLQGALEAMDSASCSHVVLEEILVEDQGAAAGLLRLANSAYFGVKAQVRTLSIAVRVVGFRRLGVLLRHLLAGKLLEALEGDGGAVAHVRKVALAAAVLAYEIGEELQLNAEELRVAALVHNVGELGLAVEAPQAFAEAERLSFELGRGAAEAVFGVSFPELSACVLESWLFPSVYVETARLWPAPARAANSLELRPFVECVHTAARAADAWSHGASAAEALSLMDAVVVADLRLDEELLGRIWERMHASVEDLRCALH